MSSSKTTTLSGLPDGLFSNQNSQFGQMFEGSRLENVDIFLSHLEYLEAFGIFYDHLVHFVLIWYIFPVMGIMHKKIWQP
jgi:hypothetical protein